MHHLFANVEWPVGRKCSDYVCHWLRQCRKQRGRWQSHWHPKDLFPTRTLTILRILVLLCLSIASPLVASDQPKPLDQQLFEDLEDDLFSDLIPVKPPEPAAAEKKKPSDLDVELQRKLGGEDLGQPQAAAPLEDIVESMRTVRDRLAAKNAATETQQMQAHIVEKFDELIAQLKQQRPQQSSQSSQGAKSEPSGQQQAGSKPGQGRPNTPSNSPASDSTTRLGQAEPTAATAADRAQLMQRAWGNLPAAQQREMQSARPEKFLPKYSRLIEEYYKRLAEDLDR